MKTLKRNQTGFDYLPYTGNEDDLDEYGRHTGIYKPVYGEAIPMKGNISTPSGSAVHAFYGTDTQYTHILIPDDSKVAITENGKVVWRGYEYEVTAVRPSLNCLSVALKMLTPVHEDEQDEDPTGTTSEDTTGGDSEGTEANGETTTDTTTDITTEGDGG